MSRPMRFAVVGCGMLAQGQHLPNIVRSPRMELAVCCDVSDQNLATCEKRFHPGRLTKDYVAAVQSPEVDAVCLATTEKLRLPVIAAAAKAGKPIYVEKPLARDLKEMQEIRQVVQQARIPFCIGHNRRSSPAMLQAHHWFRQHMTQTKPCPWRFDREGDQRPALPIDGVAGMSVRINDDWYSWKKWVFDPTQAPHGPMLFEMTHFTDLCNWFMDDEPQRVVALESAPLNHGVVIQYRQGGLATISMTSNGTFGYPKELYEVMGQGAMVAIDHMVEVRTAGIADAPARKTFARIAPDGTWVNDPSGIAGWLSDRQAAAQRVVESGDPMKLFDMPEADKGHARQLERFVDEILGQGPPVCPVEAAISASRVAFAAIRSAKESRAVSLDEV